MLLSPLLALLCPPVCPPSFCVSVAALLSTDLICILTLHQLPEVFLLPTAASMTSVEWFDLRKRAQIQLHRAETSQGAPLSSAAHSSSCCSLYGLLDFLGNSNSILASVRNNDGVWHPGSLTISLCTAPCAVPCGDWDNLLMRFRKLREALTAAAAPADLRREVSDSSCSPQQQLNWQSDLSMHSSHFCSPVWVWRQYCRRGGGPGLHVRGQREVTASKWVCKVDAV